MLGAARSHERSGRDRSRTVMDFIVNCFWDSFRAEFVAKFLAVKTETKIFGLSLEFFLRPSKAEIMAGNGCFM